MYIDRNKEDPLRHAVMKIFNADIDSPDVFYMMDEVKKIQILRKFDKSSGKRVYLGTYEILYKTENAGRFCLIMTRIENEQPVPEGREENTDEYGAWIVVQYEPGVKGRIYLKSLPETTVDSIVREYEKERR